MEETLTLTPEQLFFLGTLMDAAHINYEYVAALGELQRNYSRSRRKCLDELVQAGILRERLKGEISLRPGPKKLLQNVFFGHTETALEIYDLGKETDHTVIRFHWLDDAVTGVTVEENRLTLRSWHPDQIETLVGQRITGFEQPVDAAAIDKEAVTQIITVKQAAVGSSSSGSALFAQYGCLYTIDDSGKTVGIPVSRARQMVLAQLKGV